VSKRVLQLKEGRELIVDKVKGIIPILLPHINSPSLTRRRGVIATIKYVEYKPVGPFFIVVDGVFDWQKLFV